jgi:hypothetical protein
MIVTNNTFVSYSLARGNVQLQLILLTVCLYTIIAVPEDEITAKNLKDLSLEKFKFYTKVLTPALITATLLLNVLTDYLNLKSIEYPASIMGLCSEFTLFAICVTCVNSLRYNSFHAVAYIYWFLILE